MADENAHSQAPEPESREPTVRDLVQLCAELNRRGARYIVIGGFAMRAAGFARTTMDVDLLVDITEDNEARVLESVATLPDGAARQISPGEIAKWVVVRIGDEITVDLMRSACGMDYQTAKPLIVVHNVEGIDIPFASPELLWMTKKPTHRAKDFEDLVFLRDWFGQRGKQPPSV
jgi:hypothetical protein